MKIKNGSFGGNTLIGRRKTKRPLAINKPIHLILRLNNSCSRLIFSPQYRKSMQILKKTAVDFNIKIYELAFNYSHLHLVIKLENTYDYAKFIRALTCRFAALARNVVSDTGATDRLRARPSPTAQTIKKAARTAKVKIPLFMGRPYTRIVTWGRNFKQLIQYIYKNHLESCALNQLQDYKKISVPCKTGQLDLIMNA